MMADLPFNNLTPGEAELLALLAEECGEVVQVIGKCLRHGLWSRHPADPDGPTNYDLLHKELGDVQAAVEMMSLNARQIAVAKNDKLARIGQYLHHWRSPIPTSDDGK